jgi:hypothetical protein
MYGKATACAVAVAVAALAAACGGGGGGDESSSDRDGYVEALAGAYQAGSGGQTSEEDATCLATAVVDAASVSTLREAVSPGDISDAGAEFDAASLGLDLDDAAAAGLYEGMSGCVGDLKQELLLPMVSTLQLSDAQFECIKEGLSDDVATDLTVAVFTRGEAAANDDPGLTTALQGLISSCEQAETAAPAPAP